MSTARKLLTHQWKVLFSAGLVLGALSFLVSIILPLEYKADAQILLITRQQPGSDPLAVSKATERVAETLANAVETDAFYSQVISEESLAERNGRFANLSPRKRRTAWEKAVEAEAQFGTNLLSVSAYDTSRAGAEAWARALGDTVVKSGSDYVGTLIVARIVNEPIASQWPVRPNVALNTVLGFVVGVLGMAWLVLRRSFRIIS